MMVDDHIEGDLFEHLRVMGLGVHENEPIKSLHEIRGPGLDIHLHVPNHGQVIGTFDNIDGGNGDVAHSPPEESFHGGGTGDGIGVGIDKDQHLIVPMKPRVQGHQFFFDFYTHESLFLRVCKGLLFHFTITLYHFHRPANITHASMLQRVGIHTPAFTGKLGMGNLFKESGCTILPKVILHILTGQTKTITEGFIITD